MAESNVNKNGAVVIGTIDRFAKPNHREDYIVRIVKPKKRGSDPQVEMKVYVNNTTESSPYKGLSSKGAFFRLDIDQFNELVEMAPKIREAIKAATEESGSKDTGDGIIPDAPSLDILAGITG